MKLCFLIQNLDSGGAERTVAGLANYAVNNGHQVDVVVYENKIFYELDPKINVKLLHDITRDKNKITRFLGRRLRCFQFKKYARNAKPDVVICLLFPAIYYARFKGRKFKLIAQESSNPGWIKDPVALARKIDFFKSADKIIFQTERAKDFYHMLDNDYVVIPNGICNKHVYQIEPVELKNRTKKICAMGRFVPEKDYGTLVRAFNEVIKKHPDYCLEIYGNGPVKGDIQKLVSELNLESAVSLNESRDDALVKISDGRCFVMSSISEGMPNALMEAMAIGMPCVATDCPNGPAELIRNEENGLLVPMQDVNALCDAICRMIEDDSLAEKCSKNASVAKEEFAQDVIFEKLLESFKG